MLNYGFNSQDSCPNIPISSGASRGQWEVKCELNKLGYGFNRTKQNGKNKKKCCHNLIKR